MGKTTAPSSASSWDEKHPHGRGEDFASLARHILISETPPRAWGRHNTAKRRHFRNRNTPTGVGKTKRLRKAHKGFEKHPHGRGEDKLTTSADALLEETPPRAWGRHQHLVMLVYFNTICSITTFFLNQL